VLSSEERDRIQSAGLRYAAASGRLRHIDHGSRFEGTGTGSHIVDAVAGCLMLVRTSVFDRIGFFDEDFFFGFEEVEFCLRARRSGVVSVVNREAVTYHAGGASIGRTSPRRLYFAARNHLLLGHKLDPQASTAARTVRNATIVSLNLAHALKAEGESVFARLRAVGRGTADYFAGRFGGDASAE
jgi:GT2 family glycosyltransferase